MTSDLQQPAHRRKVLLFKAETEQPGDTYTSELNKVGFSPRTIAVVSFSFYNLEELEKKLAVPEDYSGIIFTSERCVEAVVRSLGDDCKRRIAKWKNLKVYCTGFSTSNKVKDTLDLTGIVGEKQRAEGIIEMLTEGGKNYEKPFLYPCGELAATKDILRAGLSEKGINCEPIIVYSTQPNPELPSILTDLICQRELKDWPQILIFFSPSGLKATLDAIELMPNHSLLLKLCRFVAIGPTTAGAIRERGIPVWAEAIQPNAVSLCQALKESEQQSSTKF